jgi:hypothetical protein
MSVVFKSALNEPVVCSCEKAEKEQIKKIIAKILLPFFIKFVF